MAPECITGTGYDTKADIWSFGITLIEMAEGYPPLFDEKTNQVPNRIVQDPPPRLQNPDSWSKPFLDFVMRCLTKKPENRPTASQLLDHHFIVNSSVDALLPIMESKISKKKKFTFEEDGEVDLYLEDGSSHKVLIASHNTCEDLIRKGIEILGNKKNIEDYCIFLVIDEEGTPLQEEKLDIYDLPWNILKDHKTIIQKRNKKQKKNTQVRDIKLKLVMRSIS